VWIAGKELGLKIKKKELAKVSGVSEAALRKNLQTD
jgi:transcription initiation factor TFIIIB Brf1 subunit/transcription initiation factor TFIIB